VLESECASKPYWMSWEEYIADSEKDDPPIENRLAVTLSEDSVDSYLHFAQPDPEHIGWDLRRQNAALGDMGHELLSLAVALHGTPNECFRPYDPAIDGEILEVVPLSEGWTRLQPGSLIHDSEPYLDRMWSSFDRERIETDRLLIDEMDRAVHRKWEVPPEIFAEIEKLRVIRSTRIARRKAAADAEEAEHYRKVEADADADFAIYEKWIADGEQESDPRAAEHRKRKRAITRFQIDADYDAIQKWRQDQYTEDFDPTTEQDDAITAEWEGKMAAWRAKYGHVLPHIFTDDGQVPPGLSIPEMETLLAEFAARPDMRPKHPPLSPDCQTLTPGTPMPPKLASVPAAPSPDILVSSATFIGGFRAPEYMIDGIVQRRYCYSLTAQTGVGKTAIAMRWMAHVVTGRPIGDRQVQEGNVLYLAGENPDDVRARWLVLSREMGIDPNTPKVTWLVGADMGARDQRLWNEIVKKGLEFAFVIVDTAAAYNPGDDENSNNQAGAYARQLRSLTELPGGPCVVILCHPTKRAGDDDLLPRGGGAFLAEVDGNMAVLRKDSLLAVVPFGKFRGDMAWSQRYEIEVVGDHPKLKDARGRQMRSVIARPVGEGTAAVMEKRTDADMEAVLGTVHNTPSATPTDLARVLGWTFGPKSDPNVNRVKRNLARLLKDKLVRETIGKWKTTSAGQQALNEAEVARAATPKPMFPMPPNYNPPV
jgi:AAA domain